MSSSAPTSAPTSSSALAPYTHLLVLVDYAGCAWLVVNHAARLAAAFGAQVTLLYVVDPPTGVHLSDSIATDHTAGALLDAEARDELEALRRAFPPEVRVQLTVLHGSPAEVILGAVERLGPDLLVMGTHGRTGLQRLLVGSVAEQVMRGSPVPVVIVRAPAGMPERHPPTWERAADEANG